MMALRDRIANRCVHFTGVVFNTHCKAGACYRDLRNDPEGRRGLPCLRDDSENPPPCALRRCPTDDEVEVALARAQAESEAFLRRYHAALEAGRCFECDRPFEPLRQDGRCVYAACGHRLGQGRVADFRKHRRASVS